MTKSVLPRLLFTLCLTLCPGSARAGTMTYEATNLTDTTPGEDL